MNIERINLLNQFLEEEPDNPFNLYGLAMEYQGTKPSEAQVYFDRLLAEHPTYLPTYYHAAALYANLNKREMANELYQKGMLIAQAQQNHKTWQELQRAKQALEEADEDW